MRDNGEMHVVLPVPDPLENSGYHSVLPEGSSQRAWTVLAAAGGLRLWSAESGGKGVVARLSHVSLQRVISAQEP